MAGDRVRPRAMGRQRVVGRQRVGSSSVFSWLPQEAAEGGLASPPRARSFLWCRSIHLTWDPVGRRCAERSGIWSFSRLATVVQLRHHRMWFRELGGLGVEGLVAHVADVSCASLSRPARPSTQWAGILPSSPEWLRCRRSSPANTRFLARDPGAGLAARHVRARVTGRSAVPPGAGPADQAVREVLAPLPHPHPPGGPAPVLLMERHRGRSTTGDRPWVRSG